MVQINKELIQTIVDEYKKIGESLINLSDQISAQLLNDSEEVVKEDKKAKGKYKAKEVEEVAEKDSFIVETEDGEVDLTSLSLKELKKFADEYEISYKKCIKKDELVELIYSAFAEAEEVEEEEPEDEAAEEEVEEVSLEDMSVDELKEFIEEELGLDVPKKKAKEKASSYADRLRSFIEENLEYEVEEGDEVEEVEEEAEEEEISTVVETEEGEVDLAELSVKELKKFAEEYGLEVTKKKKDDIIEELLEQVNSMDEDEEEDEEDEEIADVEEEFGLSDLSNEELADILAEYGLSTKGKREALVDRIVRAIEDGTIELEEEGE